MQQAPCGTTLMPGRTDDLNECVSRPGSAYPGERGSGTDQEVNARVRSGRDRRRGGTPRVTDQPGG